MDTFQKLNKLNDMLIDIIAFDNSKFFQLSEDQEIILFRIYLEIFNISHSNDI